MRECNERFPVMGRRQRQIPLAGGRYLRELHHAHQRALLLVGPFSQGTGAAMWKGPPDDGGVGFAPKRRAVLPVGGLKFRDASTAEGAGCHGVSIPGISLPRPKCQRPARTCQNAIADQV